ncbi:MAG: outer membrane protein assembly factor BamA, partial [Brevundimonas sp.]|nr:outer membrane protein assembly factor BamA [Brevundimonas sp.]
MIQHDASALRIARGLSPSLLALVVAAGLSGPVLAQTAPAQEPAAAEPVVRIAPAPQEADDERVVINRILVRGNQRIDQTTVLSYLPIQPGDTIDPAVLDVAVR